MTDTNNHNRKAYLTRRVVFSACHRLHSPHLSDEANAATYGKCNHINGHGHNYVAFVTLFGPLNSKTGMVMNLSDLKVHIDQAIMVPMDHKNLDNDVEYFRDKPSTAENIAVFIWDSLRLIMHEPNLLHEVKVCETENNIAIYRGDGNS